MSQFSEDEIKNYINEAFDLKLDRDAFIKPSKEVIFDIYSRFLDEAEIDWRRANQNLKFMMVSSMRYILKHFDNNYVFIYDDIMAPTRKRTTSFLIVLICLREQIMEVKHELQKREQYRQVQQEELARNSQKLSDLRLAIEEIAIKKANSKPTEQVLREIQENRTLLETLEKQSDAVAERAKSIKEDLKMTAELSQKKQAEIESLKTQAISSENNLLALNEGHNLKKKISTIEKNIKNIEELLSEEHRQIAEQEKKINHEDGYQACYEMAEKILECIEKMNLGKAKQTLEGRRKIANDDRSRLQIEVAALKEQLDQAEANRTKFKIQYNMKMEQKQAELNDITKRIKDEQQQAKLEEKNLKQKLETIRQEIDKTISERKKSFEQYEFFIKEADRLYKTSFTAQRSQQLIQ